MQPMLTHTTPSRTRASIARKAATLIFICLALQLVAHTAHARKYNVKAVMAYDYTSGKTLYKQNVDKKIAPASLTKVLTLYLVNEDIESGRIRFKDKVKVSKRAAKTGGSSMHLRAGEIVTVSKLMKGMAVASGNDACVAIAEFMEGNVKLFVERMNRKARQLGMKNTTFKTPNGLPAKGQLTTARDMLILAKAYLKRFPWALRIHKIKSITHNGYKRRNSNRLLLKCKGVDGLKTGYVNASGFNIITTAKRGNKRIIAVVLGGRTKNIRNKETAKVIEKCFTGFKKAAPKTKLAKKSRQKRQKRHIAAASSSSSSHKNSGYTLHESSWKTKSKATKRLRELKRLGFSPRMVTVDLGKKGVWQRVMIGHFSSRNQAINFKNKFYKKGLHHSIIVKV